MRYLLVLFLLCATAATSFAQADTASKPDGRIMFRSKVRQLTSYLNEGNENAAGIIFKDVAKAMDEFILQTQDAADKAKGAEKKKLAETVNNQRQLAAQFHSFRADLIRNRSSIDTWTDQFIKTLY